MSARGGYRNAVIVNGPCLRLVALALVGHLCLTAVAQSALPQRPVVPPGGNNWSPPAAGLTRALSTQDLNSGLTPEDLVNALLGPGVLVSNVTFVGANNAAGTFAGGMGIIGFEGGIMLSSGDIAFVPGPNTQDDATVNNGLNGDPDLDALIPGYTTFDACVLEFDFECQGTQVIQFQYVFTSEEYNEWVNSPFNDVFGFFLNGVNIALVPGGSGLAVSINNVNCDNPYSPPMGSFCNLYINNRCADIPPGTFPCAGNRDTQMDGLTVVLTATGTLELGLNHIKLAIADAGDPVLDSNVFIKTQSFVCGEPTGACCDTVLHICTDAVLEVNCRGANDVWHVGLICQDLSPPCTPVQQLPGDDCEHAISIPAIPYTDANTTFEKDNDYSGTCLGYYDNGEDILYSLSVTGTRCVDIIVTGATPNDDWIGLAVDTVCPPSAMCLAQATTSGTVASITNLVLTPGTYYLMIDRWPLSEDYLYYTLNILDCGTPVGACCYPDYTCQITTELDCTGLWLGPNTTCDACPQLPVYGACCYPDNTCQITTAVDCVVGVWLGGGTTCAECPPPLCAGDMNCDTVVTFDDIDGFVEALGYPGGIGWPHTCPWMNGDCNGDGNITFDDIDPFVARIGTDCSAK